MSLQQIVFTNDFNLLAANTFQQLWGVEDFSDVILATEDDQQIKVHKVILSSGSPFFKSLLLRNPQKEPIIYLKDIKLRFLEMVLRFIYLGEVEVAKDEVEEFFKTAADLKVSGLGRENADPLIPKIEIEHEQKAMSLQKLSEYEDIEKSKKNGTSISYKGSNGSERMDVESLMREDSEDLVQVFPCPLCQYKTSRTSNLYKHKWSQHRRKLKRPCDLCDFQAEKKRELKEHKVEKHAGHIFKCNICHYGSAFKSHLRKHVCNPKLMQFA